jgi:hypothetical protein
MKESMRERKNHVNLPNKDIKKKKEIKEMNMEMKQKAKRSE